MDTLREHKEWYARLVMANAGLPATEARLAAALAETPRERFLGPGPWKVFTRSGYVDTPSESPALIYQDVTVALNSETKLNNGQPSLHALCIAALRVREGDRVLHVGAGTGYYTAILAKLAGESGRVVAYEIDEGFTARAKRNLEDLANVEARCTSGVTGPLPISDVVYVNAGVTEPARAWLDALGPDGRLMVPLTPSRGAGYMLLVTRKEAERFSARFVCGVLFTPCQGARDEETDRGLEATFARGGIAEVRSLHLGQPREGSPCWFAGRGWWLSTAEA